MKRYLPLLVLFFLALPVANAQEAPPEVYVVKVDSAIGPAISDYLKSSIRQAEAENAACLIIELDTPGGLAESMRVIVMDIMASRIPIVVYVSPSGARAASAGVMITMSADIAAMAPGTNIGAAHPVGAGGQKIDKTMSDKITNDMVANAKSIAEKRGRNAEWVEQAIRESVAATESEALDKNIIDLVASDRDDLLEQINGREISAKGVLKLDNAKVKILEESLRTKILKTISDPNIAYILLMIGLAGLYFELSHPGAIFPGVVGAICVVLAFFALQTLPVNFAGILLIILAIIFFILEMKITSYGMLSIAGITSMLLGSLMLFKSADTGIKISLSVLLPTVLTISGFFVLVAGLVFRAQLSKPKTGASGLMGEIGVVRARLDPDGKVFVHGELWKAVAQKPVEEGARVKVVGIENLVLEVEPLAPEEVAVS
jgi:membrane-bound serine protease (ClpP class)